MERLFKNYILRKLQRYLPRLQREQLNLGSNLFSLSDVDIPAVEVGEFVLDISIAFAQFQMQWSALFSQPISISLKGVRVSIRRVEERFQDFDEGDRSQQPQGSFSLDLLKSCISTVTVKISDFELCFLDRVRTSMQDFLLQFNNSRSQQNMEVSVLLIEAALNSLQVRFHNIKLQSIFQTAIIDSQILIEELAVEKLAWLTNVGVLFSLGPDPLLKPTIHFQRGKVLWSAHKLNEIIQGIVQFVTTAFELAPKKKVLQTDPANPQEAAITIEGDQIRIICLNRSTVIGKIIGSSASCTIDIFKYVALVAISAKDLKYFDCSNYPHTIAGEVTHGYPLIQSRTLEIDIKVFDDYSPKILVERDQYNFVDIKLQHATLFYFQQPFLRFMDFLIEQFIGLIIKDFGVTEIPKEVIYSKLNDPKFTLVTLSVEGGTAQVKPLPTSREALLIKFDRYVLKTNTGKSQQRILNRDFPFLWEMILDMKASNCRILGSQQITNNFDLDILVTKAAYSLLYMCNQTQFDKTFRITINISAPLKISASRSTYLSIMRILLNNVFFDDQLDSKFLCQVTVPTPILATVNIPDVRLIIFNKDKLLRIQALHTSICFERQPTRSSILIKNSAVTAYQYAPFSFQIRRQIILQKLRHQDAHFLEYQQLNKQSGEKNIQIKISAIQGRLNLQWLFTAINFFVLDDTVQIIQPQDYRQLKPLSLELVIEQVECLLQAEGSAFAAKGNLFLAFAKNQHGEAHVNHHEGQIQNDLPTSCLKIESSHLGLYNEDRQVVQPISIQWKSTNFQCNCSQEWRTFNESILNLETLKLFLTLAELEQLIEAVRYLTVSMWQADQFGEEYWAEQYSQINQSRKMFNVEQVEIWIVNSTIDAFTPVFTIQLSSVPLLLQQAHMKMLISANIILECQYFNPIASQLEPVIEKFSFDLAMVRNKQSYPKLFLQIEPNKQSKFSQLNVNIHQNFITILFHALKRKNRKQGHSRKLSTHKQEVVEQKEQISLYVVENLTGYDLSILVKDQILLVAHKEEQELKTTLSQIDKSGKIGLEFVSISRERIKLRNINVSLAWNTAGKSYAFILKSLLKGQQKVYQICGDCVFQNETQFEQVITIFDQHSTILYSEIVLPNDRFIPKAELMDRTNKVRIDSKTVQSHFTINVSSLFNREFNYVELQYGNEHFMLRVDGDRDKIRRFIICAPINIYNCLPCPIQVSINNYSSKIENLSSLQLYVCNSRHYIELVMELEDLKGNPFRIHTPLAMPQNCVHDYSLRQAKGQQSLNLSIRAHQDNGVLYYYIYPKICLIDTTGNNLKFYVLQGHALDPIIKLNPNLAFLHKDAHLILEFESFQSNEVSINALGDTSIQIKRRQLQFCELLEFGINISVTKVSQNAGVYSKTVEIAPRYVLINKTGLTMQAQQEDSFGNPIQVLKDERVPYHWQDCTKEKRIMVRFEDDKWSKWSHGMYLSDIKQSHFYCSNGAKSRLYFECSISKRKSTFYIQFTQEPAPYKLINRCSQIIIAYGQVDESETLMPGEERDFSWAFPSLRPILNVKLNNEVQFQLDLQDPHHRNAKGVAVWLEFEENKKILVFGDQAVQHSPEQRFTKLIYINLQLIVLSIIAQEQSPVELNLLTLSGVEIGISEQNKVMEHQVRVKFLQIDNNFHVDALQPVLLTPAAYDTLIDSNGYALDVKWARNHLNEIVTMIEYFQAQVVPLSIRLDQEYLTHLMGLVRSIKSEIPEFLEERDSDIAKSLFQVELKSFNEWFSVEIPPPKGNLYIKQLVLPLIQLQLSFQAPYQQNSNFALSLLANSLGSAIKNIENAPIKLKGLKMHNVYDSQTGLKTLLWEHYKFVLLQQILPILGSIELIGNPLAFFSRISTGVVDLIEKPIEGIAQGPLELGLGVLEGATSLLKNTFAGAFYSVNKITSSVANQIVLLTLDEQFIQQRRKFMQRKPTQVFEGLYFGLQSLLHGVGDGLLGFFSHPYRIGRREGALGILKGSAMGMVGVLVKPIAGAFDAASKTAEGLTNTATHFDDRPRDKRMRQIRAFYESTRYIKAFSEDDARFVSILPDIILFDSFLLHDVEMKRNMHILICQHGVLYLTPEGSVKHFVKAEVIQEFKLFQDTNQVLRLYLLSQQQPILKLKFQKMPFSQILGQKLQLMIDYQN